MFQANKSCIVPRKQKVDSFRQRSIKRELKVDGTKKTKGLYFKKLKVDFPRKLKMDVGTVNVDVPRKLKVDVPKKTKGRCSKKSKGVCT